MGDFDVISLSSDSSRPSSPFINVSEVFNDTEKNTNFCRPSVSHDEKPILVASPLKDGSPLKNRIVHTLSESDSENETRVNSGIDLSSSELNRLLEKYSGEKSTGPNSINRPTTTSEIETVDDSLRKELRLLQKSPSKDLTKKRNGGLNNKMTKAQRLEEKLQKQREKDERKAEKLAAKEFQNFIKPGNCLKYMTVMMDSTLATCSFGGVLIAAIQNSESKCHLSSHDVSFTIFWKRELPGLKEEEENYLLVIWDWQTVIPAIKNHSLCTQIQDIQAQYLGKIVYLVFYGLNSYYSYIKSKRKNSTEPSKKKRKENDGIDCPYVTRKEIEEELIELQIMTNCNHRLIDSPEDLGQLIVQITKAIAETPFKLDKQRRELESLQWFAVGDSRDCVTVDKAGNGLLRLWQQQLCQFNLAGHDVAQAIASVYPSPQSLMEAYDKCSSQKEAEDLLKEIQVRRCQGPISSSRRIGPELSKKICTFFCSMDGDTPLSQEQ